MIQTSHSGAKSKIYEQNYLNYSFRCKKKYEVEFFKIGDGGCVRAKPCRRSNSRKLLRRKVLGIYIKLILEKKIFHKNYSHPQKI